MARKVYQVVDVVAAAESEYGQPFVEIVRGFASDGESLRSIADILHLDECRLHRFMRRNGIRVNADNRPAHEQTVESRRRIAGTLLLRSGRRPITWHGRDWTYPELEAATGIPADTIRMRINNGWPASRAVTKPVIKSRK